MSNNYGCTHCGMRYSFHPGRCSVCGEAAVINDGRGDRERAQQQEQEKRRVAQQQRREADNQARRESARLAKQRSQKIETNRAKEKAAKKKAAPNQNKNAKRTWSWWAAIIGFFIGTGVGMKQLELEQQGALVFGGIVGIICGFYYVQIIVIAVLALIVYAIAQKQ